MATVTIVPDLTTISTCDAATGWNAGTLDPDIKMQGTNALSNAWV